MSASGQRRGEDGFVLIAVLGLLLVLGLITASLLTSTRSHVKMQAASATRIELAALADGIASLAAVRGGQQQTITGTPASAFDGTAAWCSDGRSVVMVEVVDVAGLVDVNATSQEVLEVLLAGNGLDAAAARRLAATIADFRDPDDIARPGGAEAREYIAAGRGYGPKNAPFDSVEELDQVLGMTPELLARLRPLLTVHSRVPAIDLASAPLALLQALRRGDPAGSDGGGIDRERFQPPRQVLLRTGGRGAARSPRRTFAVRVTVMRPPAAAFTRAAVIEIAPQTPTGLQVHEWTAPAAEPKGPPPQGLLPCFAAP